MEELPSECPVEPNPPRLTDEEALAPEDDDDEPPPHAPRLATAAAPAVAPVADGTESPPPLPQNISGQRLTPRRYVCWECADVVVPEVPAFAPGGFSAYIAPDAAPLSSR
ncbi:MAG: hypothetical protein WCK47_08780 [bacterium]|nr:hypothetical protein [Candidatus Sumerlaeota bacterium]